MKSEPPQIARVSAPAYPVFLYKMVKNLFTPDRCIESDLRFSHNGVNNLLVHCVLSEAKRMDPNR